MREEETRKIFKSPAVSLKDFGYLQGMERDYQVEIQWMN